MMIKVCGMREPGNIQQVSALKPNYMGFIFYPQSKRFVDASLSDITMSVGNDIKKTGVFVDEDIHTIADRVIQFQLDAVQLHGHETPEFCRSLKVFIRNMETDSAVELIKAFGLSPEFDFATLADYEDVVDYFLFDTKTIDYGGSGMTFDWHILDSYSGKKRFFLSGGLSPENIKQVKQLGDARLAGVDLNSKFETEPGIKDIDKLKTVFNLLAPLEN